MLLLLVFLWALFKSDNDGKKSLLSSLFGILKCIFSGSILRIILLVFCWTALLTIGLNKIHLWEFEPAFIKITLVFFITAMVIIGKSITTYTPKFFIKLVSGLIGFDIITNFLTDYLSTNFFLTFILLSFTVLISGAYEYNKIKKEHLDLNKSFEKILSFIGLIFLYLAVSNIIKNLDSIFTIRTLKTIILPIIYTVMSIPLFKLIKVCSVYECCFSNLDIKVIPNLMVKLYLIIRIAAYCKFNTDKIESFKFYYLENFAGIKNLKDTKIFFKDFIQRTKKVSFDNMGFNPEIARFYLEEVGISADLYKYHNYCSDYGNYSCYDSKYLIGINTVNYYLEGSQNAVKCLSLNLNLYANSDYSECKQTYIEYIKILCQRALNWDLDKKIIKAINEKKEMEMYLENYKITVKFEIYSRPTDYGTKFNIEYMQKMKVELAKKIKSIIL